MADFCLCLSSLFCLCLSSPFGPMGCLLPATFFMPAGSIEHTIPWLSFCLANKNLKQSPCPLLNFTFCANEVLGIPGMHRAWQQKGWLPFWLPRVHFGLMLVAWGGGCVQHFNKILDGFGRNSENAWGCGCPLNMATKFWTDLDGIWTEAICKFI